MINNPGTNLLPAQINRRFDFSRRRRCSAAANPRHKLAADGDGVFIEGIEILPCKALHTPPGRADQI